MHSRSKIAWHEYQNHEQYLPYYEEQATLRQSVLYITYGLRPMSDAYYRSIRKAIIYKVNKSKDTKIVHAKDLLLSALLDGKLQAYGQEGICKAAHLRDEYILHPFSYI